MNEELWDLIANIISSTSDVFMIYILSQGFTCLYKELDIYTKTTYESPAGSIIYIKINYKRILFLFSYGITLGIIANLVDDEYGFRFIAHIIFLVFLKIYMRDTSFWKIFFIYILITVTIIPIQFTSYIFLSIFSITDYNTMLLIAQAISLVITFIIYKKIKLYKIFLIFENNLVSQLLFSLFVIALYIGVIIFELYYNSVQIQIIFLLYCFMVISFIFIFGMTLSKLSYYTKTLPKKHHEYKNILSNIYISAYTDDIPDIRQTIEHYLDVLDIHFDPMIDFSKDNPLLNFINKKLTENNINASINFSYQTRNIKVTDATISIILGILLDNAINATINKELIINIKIERFICLIEIGNDIKPGTDVTKFSIQGYTTNQTIGHGHGLDHLKEVVDYIHGSVDVTIQNKNNTNYVFFKVEA